MGLYVSVRSCFRDSFVEFLPCRVWRLKDQVVVVGSEEALQLRDSNKGLGFRGLGFKGLGFRVLALNFRNLR